MIRIDQDTQLEPVAEEMAPVFQRLVSENYAYLAEWLEWPRHCKTREAFSDFISAERRRAQQADGMSFAIIYRGLIVGMISFNAIYADLQRADIGYWLIQSYQGLGIMTRACQAMTEHAFAHLNVSKVQVSVAAENLPSRAVCERLGMQLEGVISHREKVGDRILSHAVYAAFIRDNLV